MRCFGSVDKKYHCKIVLLDETELIQEIHDATKGQDLLDITFKHLNLLETVYFGFRFIETNGQTRWLDSGKCIVKQMKNVNPMSLYFGVKYYAADPCKLLEEITRYQFFLQIKQDICQSRLPVPFNLLAQLCAYAVQSELGDYDPRRHQAGYVSEFHFVTNQTTELETKISELHKTLSGQVPAVAEMNFLEKVKWLDLYGADLHPVLGEDNVEYFLGLIPSGVVVLRNKMRVGNYYWPRIVKIYRKDKYFMLQAIEKNNESNTYGFELPTKQACKHLWRCCSEHQTFFKLTQNKDQINGIGDKFTQRFVYNGRSGSLQSNINRSVDVRDRPATIVRVPSRRYQRRLSRRTGNDANLGKEDSYNQNGYVETSSNIIVPAGRHVVQPVIYRSTSLPKAMQTKSVYVAPWDDPNQKGLFVKSTNQSPRMARNNATAYHAQNYSTFDSQNASYRRNSSSSLGRYRNSRASDAESDISRCSKSSRHSHHSSKSTSSHHHHHHHHRCRHRKSGEESGNESDSSRKKHRRRRKCCNTNSYKLVDSEAQWKEIQKQQQEMKEGNNNGQQVRSGVIHTLPVKDYSTSSYINQALESDSEVQIDNTLNRHRKKQHFRSDDSSQRNGNSQEVRKHVDVQLVEPSEEVIINYKRAETDTSDRLFKIRYSPTPGRAAYRYDRHQAKSNGDSTSNDENFQDRHISLPSALYSTPRSVLKSNLNHNTNTNEMNEVNENGYTNGRLFNYDKDLKLQEVNHSNHLNGDSIYHSGSEGLNSFEMNTNHVNTSMQQPRPNSYVNCNRLDYYSNGRCQNGYDHLNGQNMNGQRYMNGDDPMFNHPVNYSNGNHARVTFQTPPSTTTYFNKDMKSEVKGLSNGSSYKNGFQHHEMSTEL